MKLTLVLCLLASSAMAQKPVGFTWAARPSPGYTACTSGPNCLTGFTLTDYWTLGDTTVVGHYPQSSTGTTISPTPGIGTHVYTLAQDYTDAQGVPHETTGNPGIVVTCRKNFFRTGRVCSYGKTWAGQ